MATFIDRAVLHITAGAGGNGCASIRREKFKPLAGPDGANGGDGGSVILRVDSNVTTLMDFHHLPHRKASAGGFGKGDFKEGAKGEDLILLVPQGTVIRDRAGNFIADLVGHGSEFVAARGGKGGLGNAALANSKRKAPGFALLGEPGEERTLMLEMKSIADVALVGYPSAGKSSLIAAMSSARPKIAQYPFTTLTPNLGVVEQGEYRFTMADVPGLIPGASEGKGLGLDFLRHIERCLVIVHVLDAASLETDRDPIHDLAVIEGELSAYAKRLDSDVADLGLPPLMERPVVIALNKTDMPDGAEMAELVREQLKDRGVPVLEVSALTRKGLRELALTLGELVAKQRSLLPEIEVSSPVIITPRAENQDDFTITPQPYEGTIAYRVEGEKPERWVKQTDFTNDEAIGYLADRLNRLGVEDALYSKGAKAGDTVLIGGDDPVIFDWEPTIAGGAEFLGQRGTDLRLEEQLRPTRAEKREVRKVKVKARMDRLQAMEAERKSGHWADPSSE